MNLAELLAQHQASPELSAAINSFVRASQDGMVSALEETRQKLETLEAAAKKVTESIERNVTLHAHTKPYVAGH